jgi:PBSX family phage terminase large subunit
MEQLVLPQNSTPNLEEFDPTIIPYQYQVIKDVRCNYDYSQGVHEILLSGSVGSAKSILMAHLGLTHVLGNEKSRVLLGRRALPDLKETLVTKISEHLEGIYTPGKDYQFRENTGYFEFRNGSEFISRSWADKRYRKLRSLELSAALIEELTENSNAEFDGFYKELRARVGRLPTIKENFICCATNPDAPSHAAYEYFIVSDNPSRHVYYSVTTDNPFLSDWYIEQLKQTYTKKEILRMIYGQWIEIKSEVIYYAFDIEKSRIREYEVNEAYPIGITFDFNIGEGKPFSVCLFQYIHGNFYFFDEIVVEGMRTLDAIEEAAERGLLDYNCKYIVYGDAAGRARTTNYNKTDYEQIRHFLRSYYVNKYDRMIEFDFDVPVSNPPVRKRHLIVNGQLENANGQTHVFILQEKCPTLVKGFNLTKLKKGGNYIEDDSDPWQHITTAAGYGILKVLDNNEVINRTSYGRAY